MVVANPITIAITHITTAKSAKITQIFITVSILYKLFNNSSLVGKILSSGQGISKRSSDESSAIRPYLVTVILSIVPHIGPLDV